MMVTGAQYMYIPSIVDLVEPGPHQRGLALRQVGGDGESVFARAAAGGISGGKVAVDTFDRATADDVMNDFQHAVLGEAPAVRDAYLARAATMHGIAGEAGAAVRNQEA